MTGGRSRGRSPPRPSLFRGLNFSVVSEEGNTSILRSNNQINNNLEQQAQAIYQQIFIDNPDPDWIEGSLSDIANITMGQSPSGSSYNEDGIGAIFFQGRAEFGFRFPTIRLYTTEPKRMAYAKIDDYNSSVYYENPNYIFECYKAKKML